ncbi:MAG TPA: enoyl-CoA hydratase-related protein [bacterium]|nr:enoyl-CoA hydratase-related protein [bacterium]
MPYTTLELSKDGPVAVLRLNRPAQYNALDHHMTPELLEAILEIKDDPAIRALVLTGTGTAFCAGGDVKAFAQQGAGVSRYIERMVVPLHAFVSHLVRMAKPVVAAVNGVAAGAGMSLALACDLVVARADAVFTAGYSRIGASPDGSMTYFLVRQIGVRRAMELYLTNRVLTAQEALAWGLVTRVAPAETFLQDAQALARELAAGPTVAYGHAKALFAHGLNQSLETQLELEARDIADCARTQDFQEGVKAFAEKRKAEFKGR